MKEEAGAFSAFANQQSSIVSHESSAARRITLP